MAYQTLNRLKWTGRLGKASIVIRHRGSPCDRKTVAGTAVTEIRRSHFRYANQGRETFIPHHRVLEILVDGVSVWKRKEKGSTTSVP